MEKVFRREVFCGVFGRIFWCLSLDGCMAFIEMGMKEIEGNAIVGGTCKENVKRRGRREGGGIMGLSRFYSFSFKFFKTQIY